MTDIPLIPPLAERFNTTPPNVITRDIENACENYQALEAKLVPVQDQGSQTLLEFATLAKLYKVPALWIGNIVRPFIVTDHNVRSRWSKIAEFICYFAGAGILFVLLGDTLAISLPERLVLIAACTIVFAFVFAVTFGILSDIRPENPESIKQVKIVLAAGFVLFVVGVVAFGMTRGSADPYGVEATIYRISGPIVEVGCALLAAGFRLAAYFYGWSSKLTDAFNVIESKLTELRQKMEFEISIAIANYVKYLALPDPPVLEISLKMRETIHRAAIGYLRMQNLSGPDKGGPPPSDRGELEEGV